MRKLIALVEALALAAGIITVITINPQTTHMMVEASRAANGPHESAMGNIIAFARAAGIVAMLTVSRNRRNRGLIEALHQAVVEPTYQASYQQFAA